MHARQQCRGLGQWELQMASENAELCSRVREHFHTMHLGLDFGPTGP